MRRGRDRETDETTSRTTWRLTTEATVKVTEGVTTADPVVEQMGQRCVLGGPEVASGQRWNCAERKIRANRNATIRRRWLDLGMYMVRRSLGGKRCRVKQTNKGGSQDSPAWLQTHMETRKDRYRALLKKNAIRSQPSLSRH